MMLTSTHCQLAVDGRVVVGKQIKKGVSGETSRFAKPVPLLSQSLRAVWIEHVFLRISIYFTQYCGLGHLTP